MKKIFTFSILSVILFFTISSCSKNGATPTGTLTGFVTTYDQYGFKILGDLAGVTVHISDSTKDSTVTNSAGAYTFNNLKTGIYTLTYSARGFAPVTAYDYSFPGGGTLIRNQSISLYPSFPLYRPTIIDTTIATDPGVLIRGTDTANQLARTFIIFGGSASPVSATPGHYVYENTGTIQANAGGWSIFITSQELTDAGLAAGSTAYFVVYPYSTGAPTYQDLTTGQTVYTAIGTPSTVLSIVVP
jgi:hypothetical protein